MKRTLEQRKMQIAKAATTAASSKYNIGGIKKGIIYMTPFSHQNWITTPMHGNGRM